MGSGFQESRLHMAVKSGRAKLALKVLLLVLAPISLSLLAYAADMKPEDLVAKHLDSLGSQQTRAALKSRGVQGKLTMKIVIGSQPGSSLQGSWGLVSEEQKSRLVMHFNYPDYRGEQFVFNGNKIYIAATAAAQDYSRFAGFVHGQDYIIREGLLGGELSTSWALENLDKNHPKLTYEGLKKLDGHEVQDVQYHCKHSSDMQIHLFFEPETGHHLRTLYSMAVSPNMGRTVTSSVNQQEIRYTIDERFGDFKTTNGTTLPSTYSIEFTQETQSGRTDVYHWDMTIDQASDNVGLDPKNFDIK
jgi:hypothetical protein